MAQPRLDRVNPRAPGAAGAGDAPTAPLVSEEEVKFLIRQGAAHGVLERAETELVHRVFQFTDTTVRAFMVPRPRILALDIEMPPDQVLARVVEYGRTRPGRTSGGGRR